MPTLTQSKSLPSKKQASSSSTPYKGAPPCSMTSPTTMVKSPPWSSVDILRHLSLELQPLGPPQQTLHNDKVIDSGGETMVFHLVKNFSLLSV